MQIKKIISASDTKSIILVIKFVIYPQKKINDYRNCRFKS